MKIKKVDDKPMVIHTKEKAKIHAHEPKGAKIKGSNIYTVERGPKVHDTKANEMDKKASAKLMLQKSAGGKRTYRKSTIHQSEAKDKGLSRFKRNIRESGTSIKTKNTNLHIAGRTGALAAGAVTEQVEGGHEVSQAAYLAYESSRPVTGTASKGAALFRKKAAAEARKRIKKVEAGKKLAKRTANIMCNQQSVTQSRKKDLFVRNTMYDTGIYTASAGKRNKMISNSILSAMNNDISKVRKQGDIYECEGTFFTAEQIPKISGTSLNEIKAEDNIIDFGKNKYFKYVSRDGQEHCLYTDNKGIGAIVSEIMRGEPYDPVLERYASFWNYMMTKDPVYVQLSYSDEEIRGYMENAGIKNGFFTVKMGDREATQFYSATKTTSPIQSKERYDARYKNLTSGGILLDEYEAGDIFKIGNKEYVLSESHTLDIPYGEDIYNIEYPSNYKFGKKVEE